ncbi:imidazole glycerol phosphate synthase subunit HisF [Acetobacterium paludosum]|uniref:Imidazole glycerol phosphate synthase subunit HisF n=1 Tax=Acetobacterium paludosum TaxID=52693 RepID=A0A923HW22_9FIRM|nr:imidazole glycerol phosphate synthase subunit HisF [Acetobacterium paludosum]MBC3888237.1 imidazole glycerol phosphate synthase subunit HisF [Acetobacterium paludosum]
MKNTRVIARMDIKGPNLVKGIQFEGLRKIGNPNEFSKKYYEQGIDEIIYIDIVASLYERNNLSDIVSKTTEDIFIPITVGGGIRSIEDVTKLLRCGADKVAINTAALKRPELITEISNRFGSQCMVLSIQAKKIAANKWEAYYDCGREKTGIDVVQWARKGYELGAGEILLTSVDKEGTQAGFDCELIKAVSTIVPIPVIASGGMGDTSDFIEVVKKGKADAVAVGSVLHYDKLGITEIKANAIKEGITIRG